MLHEERFLFIAVGSNYFAIFIEGSIFAKEARKTDAANKTYFKIADFFVFPGLITKFKEKLNCFPNCAK